MTNYQDQLKALLITNPLMPDDDQLTTNPLDASTVIIYRGSKHQSKQVVTVTHRTNTHIRIIRHDYEATPQTNWAFLLKGSTTAVVKIEQWAQELVDGIIGCTEAIELCSCQYCPAVPTLNPQWLVYSLDGEYSELTPLDTTNIVGGNHG